MRLNCERDEEDDAKSVGRKGEGKENGDGNENGEGNEKGEGNNRLLIGVVMSLGVGKIIDGVYFVSSALGCGYWGASPILAGGNGDGS